MLVSSLLPVFLASLWAHSSRFVSGLSGELTRGRAEEALLDNHFCTIVLVVLDGFGAPMQKLVDADNSDRECEEIM